MKLRKLVLIGLSIGIIFFVGIAVGAQLHMQNAMALLQNAKHELQQTSPEQKGHSARAIKFINQALHEVHAGITAGK